MKTIFITGASTGLGKASAKLFQSKGWNVIATMRNPESDTELHTLENVTLLPLDVTNPEQIKSTVKKALEMSSIDLVFNNAGYGLIGPLEALTDDQIVKQLNTNLLGVIRVTQAFIPYFREKRSGMFITTTSIGGLIAFPLGSTYHATKWALEGWSESLAFELNTFGVDIKTVSPGGIKTDFISRSLDMGTQPEYEPMINTMFSNTEAMMEGASEPELIAEVVYEAATDGKKQLRYVAGKDANELYAQRLEMGAEAFREQFGKQFI
ncbi:SDR family oxidoreductase [Chryseobacterium sp. PTM-20240506]|uniref:SDR family oxidoreductase n=1 Tax=unclassified Chryseobacterium TaxID=2593645 RepID=UPI00155776C2|nr:MULTISPECIES: SDR family oxidoreductase [unclassified Chryseobacterium]MDC8103749.1 SDR family oxidoreductase [Chryseobacterium sp. B21-037]MDQ1803357.1 SDR family oxidoreductase [Chryseobacterium sp. CKR4-1]WBV57282.1 SDR family oxidoreductase [Chryseobacterium daecheongense]